MRSLAVRVVVAAALIAPLTPTALAIPSAPVDLTPSPLWFPAGLAVRDKSMVLHPEVPIQGDRVRVYVPSFVGDDCRSLAARVRKLRPRRGITRIRITRRKRGATCGEKDGARTELDLGKLRAGRYVIALDGGQQLAFEVLPADTNPGQLPLELRVV